MSGTPCCDTDKGVMTISPVLVAGQVGEFSLAGAGMKFPVTERALAVCGWCGWKALGWIEDGVIENGVYAAGAFVVDRVL